MPEQVQFVVKGLWFVKVRRFVLFVPTLESGVFEGASIFFSTGLPVAVGPEAEARQNHAGELIGQLQHIAVCLFEHVV